MTYCRLAGAPLPFPTITDWTGVSTLGLPSDGDGTTNAPYALPNPEEPGSIKMALDRSGPDVDADERSFEPDPERLDRLAGWAAKRFLPLVEARPPETCLYTNTPDGEFVLDRLGPIVVGSPCSGHGFKFAPLIGKILADMATREPITLRLDAFRADRAVDATPHDGSRVRRLMLAPLLRPDPLPPTRSRPAPRASPRSAARRASGACASPTPGPRAGTPRRPCARVR